MPQVLFNFFFLVTAHAHSATGLTLTNFSCMHARKTMREAYCILQSKKEDIHLLLIYFFQSHAATIALLLYYHSNIM